MSRGAIILCGGSSSRMGQDKACLPFRDGETLIGRVLRTIGQVVPAERIVCVAAPGQALPPIPVDVAVIFDRTPQGGPLAALADGLAALRGRADVAYVSACDTPLLAPAFVERMFNLLGDFEIAAPHDSRRWHPLAGVYRVSAALQVAEKSQKSSLASLLETCRTRRVSLDELRDVDPTFASLASCNTPDEYRDLSLGRFTATAPACR